MSLTKPVANILDLSAVSSLANSSGVAFMEQTHAVYQRGGLDNEY